MVFFHSYKVAIITFAMLLEFSSAKLSTDFYNKTCPHLADHVRTALNYEIKKSTDVRMRASLLRLHFHDCFVNGCDGSILLVGKSGEQSAAPNLNSVRGYDVIDKIKDRVEKFCGNTVSCADIVALAARESVSMAGGPLWDLPLGRRDSRTSNKNAAQNDLPTPTSNLQVLIKTFNQVGLNERDLVALSGAHTIGKAQCQNFRDRIYKENATINTKFATDAQKTCPQAPGNGDGSLEDLDGTGTNFDNRYFKDLVHMRGLLHSDQQLVGNGKESDRLVLLYSKNQTAFFIDFASAMVKMSLIKPLTGNHGEIRKTCSKPNSS